MSSEANMQKAAEPLNAALEAAETARQGGDPTAMIAQQEDAKIQEAAQALQRPLWLGNKEAIGEEMYEARWNLILRLGLSVSANHLEYYQKTKQLLNQFENLALSDTEGTRSPFYFALIAANGREIYEPRASMTATEAMAAKDSIDAAGRQETYMA